MKGLLFVAVASTLVATPVLAQSKNELIEHGNQVFQHWCAPCHAPGPRHPGTQALEVLYKGSKPAALEQRTDLLPEVTKVFVRNGVSMMAPFRKTEISDADLDALAAYLAPKE
jgi:Cytochrome c, mono- and diheme variants